MQFCGSVAEERLIMKRLFVWLLCMAMVCQPVAGSDFSNGGVKASGWEDILSTSSGTCGENLTWTLDDEGTLMISGTGRMEDFRLQQIDGESGTTAPWSKYYKDIVKVIIPAWSKAFHQR